jgi:hypothetical protein
MPGSGITHDPDLRSVFPRLRFGLAWEEVPSLALRACMGGGYP